MGKPRATQRRRGLSRRDFLRRAAWASAAVAALPACGEGLGLDAKAGAEGAVFRHGVASGDPLGDRVILWTRLTPPAAVDQVRGRVRVYADPELSRPVGTAPFTTSAARDFTVKVDFHPLKPGTTYYYRFEALEQVSPVGRTRTAPAEGVGQLRFGVVSCSSYDHGYFNAYARLAERSDLDAIVHLGDYLYEYPPETYGEVRIDVQPPRETITLADYRTRHAFYKQERDLQELHRLFPFITIWDDHESADNGWRDGAVNHGEDGRDEGPWAQRKAWAQQAYDEWMPVRYPEAGNVGRIWRRLAYGDLVDLFLLDARLYDRDEPFGVPILPTDDVHDPARRMLGPEQMRWLQDGLLTSRARWKVIGQQVVFHPWNLAPQPGAVAGGGGQSNGDSWDGYRAERLALMRHLREQGIDNVAILTGDVHSSWVADVTEDPYDPARYNPVTGEGALAGEFVVPAVTSPFIIQPPEGQQAVLATNPHIKFTDWDRRGYVLLDVTPERIQAQYWYVSTFREAGGAESLGATFSMHAGSNRIAPAVASAAPALTVAG